MSSETNILFNPLLDVGFTLFPYSCNVRSVKSGSFSEYSGVMPGWKITKIKGVPVSSHSVERILKSAQNTNEMYNIVFQKKEPRYGAQYFVQKESPLTSAKISVAKGASVPDRDVARSSRPHAPPKVVQSSLSRTSLVNDRPNESSYAPQKDFEPRSLRSDYLVERRSSSPLSSKVNRGRWPPPLRISENPLLLPSQIIMDSVSQADGEASEIWEIEASPSTSEVGEQAPRPEKKKPALRNSWDLKESPPKRQEAKAPSSARSVQGAEDKVSSFVRRCRRSQSPARSRESKAAVASRSKSPRARLQEIKTSARARKGQRLSSPEKQSSISREMKRLDSSERCRSSSPEEIRLKDEVAVVEGYEHLKPVSKSLRCITVAGVEGYEHLKPVSESLRDAAAKLWRKLQSKEIGGEHEKRLRVCHDREGNDDSFRSYEPSYSHSLRGSVSERKKRRESCYSEAEIGRRRYADSLRYQDREPRHNFSSVRNLRNSRSGERSDRTLVRSNRSRHRQQQRDVQHEQIRDQRHITHDLRDVQKNQEQHISQSRQDSQYGDIKASRQAVRSRPERLSLECSFSRKSQNRASLKSRREQYYSSSPQNRHSEKAGGRHLQRDNR